MGHPREAGTLLERTPTRDFDLENYHALPIPGLLVLRVWPTGFWGLLQVVYGRFTTER